VEPKAANRQAMASRNLTDQFTTLRSERKRKYSGSASSGSERNLGGGALLGEGGVSSEDYVAAGVRNMLPPAWVDTIEEVEDCLRDIERRIEGLKELHRKRLMVTFDDEGEQAQERQIEAAAKGITGIFRKAERVLKTITSSTDFTSSDADSKIRSNMVRTLASRLQQASVTFRRTQKDYLKQRAAQKNSGGAFDFLSEAEEQAKAGTMVSVQAGGAALTMEQIAVVDDMEREIAQRDKEIATIVESIEELSQIFKELAVLVIDQGTILDRIDFNMEQVVERVEDGVVELEKAEQYQKSARPRWCICVLLVLIAILMTLLVLKNTDNNNNNKS